MSVLNSFVYPLFPAIHTQNTLQCSSLCENPFACAYISHNRTQKADEKCVCKKMHTELSRPTDRRNESRDSTDLIQFVRERTFSSEHIECWYNFVSNHKLKLRYEKLDKQFDYFVSAEIYIYILFTYCIRSKTKKKHCHCWCLWSPICIILGISCSSLYP